MENLMYIIISVLGLIWIISCFVVGRKNALNREKVCTKTVIAHINATKSHRFFLTKYHSLSLTYKYNNKEYFHIEETTLSKEDIMFDEIMLRLRLDEGLDINKFNKKFKVDFKEKYQEALQFNLENKLVVIKKNILKTTLKGSLLLNDVLSAFLEN